MQFVESGLHSHRAFLEPESRPGFGKPVIFTATVGSTAPGGGIPAGQVSFSADGSPISGCPNVTLNESAQATCTTSSSVGGGSHGGRRLRRERRTTWPRPARSPKQSARKQPPPPRCRRRNPSVTGQSITITANVSYELRLVHQLGTSSSRSPGRLDWPHNVRRQQRRAQHSASAVMHTRSLFGHVISDSGRVQRRR